MEVKLHHTFEQTGNTMEGFIDAITSMDKATTLHQIKSEQLQMGAVVNTYADAQEITNMLVANNSKSEFADVADEYFGRMNRVSADDKIMLVYMEPDKRTFMRTLSKETLRKNGYTDDLLSEIETSSKMLIRINHKLCSVSPLAYTTLLRRAALGGDAMNTPHLGRVSEIFKSLQWRYPQNVSVITRGNGDANIVLAVHSSKYCYMPQTILKDIYDEIAANLGKPECEKWSVSHEISCCYINFPEVGEEFTKVYGLPHEVVPGIYFGTSDSGDSSITIRGYWKINGRIAGGECFKRSHRGEIDVPEFVKSAGEKVFAKYTKVPERLCELLAIDVPDPYKTLKKIFKEIGMVSVVGKKKSDMLYKALCSEFMPGTKYTAYDIALSVSMLPERCAYMSRTYVEKLESIATKAIFADYSSGKEEEPPIILGV